MSRETELEAEVVQLRAERDEAERQLRIAGMIIAEVDYALSIAIDKLRLMVVGAT